MSISKNKIFILLAAGALAGLVLWLARTEPARAPVPPPAVVPFQSSLREDGGLYSVSDKLELMPVSGSEGGRTLRIESRLVMERPGESRIFQAADLISANLLNRVRGASGPNGGSFGVRTVLLGWTPDKREFWGALELDDGGEPPVPVLASFFRIRPEVWSVDKLDLSSGGGHIRLGAFDLRNKGILFEDMTDGLKLFAFYPELGLRMPVASYGLAQFASRCGREAPSLNYYYQNAEAGLGCDADRDLKAHWTMAGAGYLDFLTREPRLTEFGF